MRWIDRTLRFDLEPELFPNILERLRGTPARVEEKVRMVRKDPNAREILTRRDGDAWSVQEQVGHLVDLEELHIGRMEDFRQRAEVLRPADMENKKTHAANHNQRAIDDLLREFREGREHFIAELEKLGAGGAAHAALHPRLKRPMRLIDLAYFVAEHDDHHLVKIADLIRNFTRPRR